MSDTTGPTSGWAFTLWSMVGLQLVMSLSFTILAPIMPLFLPQVGVRDPRAIDLWSGILAAVTSFVGAFAAPVWGRMADRYGRKLMVLRSAIGIAVFTGLMGFAQSVWQMFAFRLVMGVVRRLQPVGYRAGGEPGAGPTAWVRAGLAVAPATGRQR